MTLEFNQRRDNLNKVTRSLASASNNPTQQGIDINAMLTMGADLAASMGITGQQLDQVVARQYKRDVRANPNLTRADVLRNLAQAERTTTSSSGTPELTGVGYQDVDEISDAFGLMQDDLQTYRADDRGFTTDEDTGLLRRETFQETKGDPVDIAPKSVLVDALNRLNAGTGTFGYDAFPGSSDAASRLEDDLKPNRKAEASLVRELNISDNQGKSEENINKEVAKRLRQEFEGSDTSGSSVRSMPIDAYSQRREELKREIGAARFNPEVRRQNEAEAQLRMMRGYTGANTSDEALGRIGEIRSLGAVKEGPRPTAPIIMPADEVRGNAQVVRSGDSTYFVDPQTGNPLAIQGPQLPETPIERASNLSPNNQGINNAFNLPQTARSWVASMMPDYQDTGGRSFGGLEQVDISRETANFSNQLRNLGQRLDMSGAMKVSPNIRSIDELQAVAEYIEREMGKRGKKLYVKDPERPNKSKIAGNQIVSGLMNEMRMSSGDERRLAHALHQLDAAKRSSVNQNPTGTYLRRENTAQQERFVDGLARTNYPTVSPTTADQLIANTRRARGGQVEFNAPEAVGSPGSSPAMQKRGSSIRVGTTPAGKPIKRDIVAEMSALSSPEAQKPFIGMPAMDPKERSASNFPQNVTFNRAGLQIGPSGEVLQRAASDPNEIRKAIFSQALGRASKKNQFNPEQTRANAEGAIRVQTRADEERKNRADVMSEIIESLPPVARRSVYPRGSR